MTKRIIKSKSIGIATKLAGVALFTGVAVLTAPVAGGLVRAQTRKPASPAESGSMKFYQSEVHSDELGLDVEINGVSVESDEGGSGGQLLNTFLLGEPNYLTLTLHPAKGAARPPAGAFVIFNINAFGRERTSKSELVYHYEWRQTNPAKPLPATIHAVLPPVVRAEPLSWQAAPKITLNAQSEAAINALINRYYAALAAKDAGQLSQLLSNASRDASVALGDPLADIEVSQKRRYQQVFSNSHWHVKPVDYAHLQYHLCADNRIVAVVNPNGSAPLVSAPDANGSTSEFTVRVAPLHGQWTLVL